jgi:hypothetical protein
VHFPAGVNLNLCRWHGKVFVFIFFSNGVGARRGVSTQPRVQGAALRGVRRCARTPGCSRSQGAWPKTKRQCGGPFARARVPSNAPGGST